MFINNFLNIFLTAIFCGISISYIFSINIFLSCIASLSILFLAFFASYLYSEKIYIKPTYRIFLIGMLLSLFLVIFKIPFFPLLSLGDFYYYTRARKIFEYRMTSKEIGEVSFIFLLVLLIISSLGIIFKNFILTFIPSILTISLLTPYPNSFSSALFFYRPQLIPIFLIVSLIFIVLSLSF